MPSNDLNTHSLQCQLYLNALYAHRPSHPNTTDLEALLALYNVSAAVFSVR
jgi:hypothetical protein